MAESDITTNKCGFCLRKDEAMEKPKVLPCTHIHCFSCLSSFYDVNHMIKCPKPDCKVVCETPLHKLPSHASEDNFDSCDVCISKQMHGQSAVVYCVECSRRFCHKHQQSHDDVLAGHAKMSMQAYKDQAVKLETRTCNKHKDQPYSLGCEVCRTIACVKCTASMDKCSNGAAHKLLPLDELVKALMEDGVLAKVVAKEDQLESLFKQASKTRAEYDDNTRIVLQLLRETRDEQLSALQLKYDQLEKKLLKRRQEAKVQLTEFMEENVLTKWTQLKNYKLKIESRSRHSHEVDLVRGYAELNSELQELTDKELPTLEIKSLVDLVKKGKSRDMEIELVSSGGLTVADDSPIFAPKSLSKLKTVKLKSASGPMGICSYKGSAYVGLHDGIVAKIDENYCLSQPFISLHRKVHSIAVHKDIIYTHSQRDLVSVHDMSGQLVTEWHHSSDDYSNALVVLPSSDEIVLPDAKNSRLAVYSLVGKLLRHIACSWIADTRIAMSAVDDSSVVLAFYTTGPVKRVFRMDVKTGALMWRREDIANCTGVACYGGKYALLSYFKSDRISVLDIATGNTISDLTVPDLAGCTTFGLEVFGTNLAVCNFDKSQVVFCNLNKSEVKYSLRCVLL